MLDNLFVCIGAQKAGTSWLYSVLSKDERFSYCPFVKEIHYFDYLYCSSPHLNNWRAHHLIKLTERRGLDLKPILSGWLSGDRSKLLTENKYKVKGKSLLAKRFSNLMNEANDEWYESLIKPNANQKYAMDITPDYAVIGEEGFTHLKGSAKNLKLLFILRDPVDRAWSGLLQGKKNTAGGIEKFLKENTNDINGLFKLCTTGKDVWPRSNYLKTILELESIGLLDKTLIKFYDDIAVCPEDFITDVYHFLEMEVPGIDGYSDSLLKRVYSTEGKTEMPSELRGRLKEFFYPMLSTLNEKISLPTKWL